MANFYAILKDAIAVSKADTASNRAVLYARARDSLDRRLNSLNPPLTAEAQQEQRKALEEAVRRIEAESRDTLANAKEPLGAKAQPRAPQEDKDKRESLAEDQSAVQTKDKGTASAATTVIIGARAAAVARHVSRHVAGIGVLSVLLAITIFGAVAYWHWSRDGAPAAKSIQRGMTDLQSNGNEPTTDEGTGDDKAAGIEPETPPSAGIAPIPRRVKTIIVRPDGTVVTVEPQGPTAEPPTAQGGDGKMPALP